MGKRDGSCVKISHLSLPDATTCSTTSSTTCSARSNRSECSADSHFATEMSYITKGDIGGQANIDGPLNGCERQPRLSSEVRRILQEHPSCCFQQVLAAQRLMVEVAGEGALVTWEVAAADEIRRRAARLPAGRPLLVSLAGMPCGGKSCSAKVLEFLLGQCCIALPMDGYHVPLAELRRLPNASKAIYRRGAPDTFDPAALRRTLQDIRGIDRGGSPSEVFVPGFEHAIGDPVPGVHRFERGRHAIVIFEGLYLMHDSDGWEGTVDLFDLRLYLNSDIDLCIERAKARNKVIPGYTPEEIDRRCEEVDRTNAEIVAKSMANADMVINRNVLEQLK